MFYLSIPCLELALWGNSLIINNFTIHTNKATIGFICNKLIDYLNVKARVTEIFKIACRSIDE